MEPSFGMDEEDVMNDTISIGFYTLDFKIPVYAQVQLKKDSLRIWSFRVASVVSLMKIYKYEWSDFVADVGGNLGLLLGASAWSVYGYAERVFLMYAKK